MLYNNHDNVIMCTYTHELIQSDYDSSMKDSSPRFLVILKRTLQDFKRIRRRIVRGISEDADAVTSLKRHIQWV